MSLEVSIDYSVVRNDKDIELVIQGNVEPYVPANFRGHPDNWSPPEGGDALIECIQTYNEDGDLVKWNGKLTLKEEDEIKEALYQEAEDEMEAAAEDAAADAAVDAMYDRMEDYGGF